MGFEMLSVGVCFDVEFGRPVADPGDWNVDYILPNDGPRAIVKCAKCRHEVKVACRNLKTGGSVILWPAQVYQLLCGAVDIHGIDEETFKGLVEVDWKTFMSKMIAAYPRLG